MKHPIADADIPVPGICCWVPQRAQLICLLRCHMSTDPTLDGPAQWRQDPSLGQAATVQACLLRRRMRQDPSLGQAAALHDCAVERMKSNSAGMECMKSSSRTEGDTAAAAGVSHPETQARRGSSSSSSGGGGSSNSRIISSISSSSQGTDASRFPARSQGNDQDEGARISMDSRSSSRSDLVLSGSTATDKSSSCTSSWGEGLDSWPGPTGNSRESSSSSGNGSSSSDESRIEAGTSLSYGTAPCDAGAPLAGNSSTQVGGWRSYLELDVKSTLCLISSELMAANDAGLNPKVVWHLACVRFLAHPWHSHSFMALHGIHALHGSFMAHIFIHGLHMHSWLSMWQACAS
eukprot:1140995-Pelagomonas_calceolata.AAC.4